MPGRRLAHATCTRPSLTLVELLTGQLYNYWLVSIDVRGHEKMYGPVTIVVK